MDLIDIHRQFVAGKYTIGPGEDGSNPDPNYIPERENVPAPQIATLSSGPRVIRTAAATEEAASTGRCNHKCRRRTIWIVMGIYFLMLMGTLAAALFLIPHFLGRKN